MTARADILAGIRRSLKRQTPDTAALEARLGTGRGLIPARTAGQSKAALADDFARRSLDVACTVKRVRKADVPAALSDYLREQNLPHDVIMAPDPFLDGIAWRDRPMLNIKRGVPDGSEQVGVTRAAAAIAETGTLMLTSSAETPATLNFLPESEVIVVPASSVVGPMEDAVAGLRGRAMPRTVNFVTGPSRTGDIEQKIEMGAHGPRRLHLLIVDDA